MKGAGKSGPTTRARAADEVKSEKAAKRHKTLFAPRTTVGPNDILVDTAAGKIKVEPAFEVKVEVNPEEPDAVVTDYAEEDAPVPPEVIVKEEVDVPFEHQTVGMLMMEKVQRLETDNAELREQNRMMGQRNQQMFQEMQKLVKDYRERGEEKKEQQYARPYATWGFKRSGPQKSIPLTGPHYEPYPNLEKTVYHFYRSQDFQPFESKPFGVRYPYNVRRIRIFPCWEVPDQFSVFWQSAFKFMEEHGSKVWNLQLAQVFNQSVNDLVDNIGKLLPLVPNLHKLTIEGSFTESDLSLDWKESLADVIHKLEMKKLSEVNFVWTSGERNYGFAVKAVQDFGKSHGDTMWSRFENLNKVELSCELEETSGNSWIWKRGEAEPEEEVQSQGNHSEEQESK